MVLMLRRFSSPCFIGLSCIKNEMIDVMSEKRLISNYELFMKNLSIGDLF